MSRVAGRITKDQNTQAARKRAPNPFGATASSIVRDERLLAGLLKATAPHHVWARSPEGGQVVEPLVQEAKRSYEKDTPIVPWEKVVVNFRNKIRAQSFASLAPKDQRIWKAKAKQDAQDRCVRCSLRLLSSF